MRVRVPMQGTGAEQSVVGKKVLQWNWTEGTALSSFIVGSTRNGRSLVDKAKPFSIPKREVWEAYKRVKANQGAAEVDGQSIEKFEEDLQNNLFKIWNRMSSGSDFPPPVRRVDIPKDNEGMEHAPASHQGQENPCISECLWMVCHHCPVAQRFDWRSIPLLILMLCWSGSAPHPNL